MSKVPVGGFQPRPYIRIRSRLRDEKKPGARKPSERPATHTLAARRLAARVGRWRNSFAR